MKKKSIRRQKKVVLDTKPLLHFERPALMEVLLTHHNRQFLRYTCYVYGWLQLDVFPLSIMRGSEFTIPVEN